jgi:hypothetical protein
MSFSQLKYTLMVVSAGFLLFACANNRPGVQSKDSPTQPISDPTGGSAVQTSGTINGGGGAGLLCGNQLEILDLYEARRAGLTPVSPPPQSEEEAVALVAEKIARHFWNVETKSESEQAAAIANDLVRPIFEARPFLNPETKKTEKVQFVDALPLSNDFGNYVIPSGCSLKQIAYFSDSKTTLSIVRTAWIQLDWLSRSLLVAHELLYLIDRRDGLEGLKPKATRSTSQLARKFVGQLFSSASPPPLSADVPQKGALYRCSFSDSDPQATYLYAFDTPHDDGLRLTLNAIRGKYGFYQMRADFKGTSAKVLTDIVDGEISQTVPLEFVGSGESSEFAIQLSKKKGSSAKIGLIFLGKNQSQEIGNFQEIRCEK